MKILIKILCVLVLISVQSFAASPVVSKNKCIFYEDLGKMLGCKEKDGYLITYGKKYCEKFQSFKIRKKPKFNSFVEKATICLQEFLANNISRMKTCNVILDWAFDSHPGCYKEAGFCEFDDPSKREVMKVVAIQDVLNTRGPSLVQSLSVFQKCGLGLSFPVYLFVSEVIDLAGDAQKSVRNELKNLIEDLLSNWKFADSKVQKYEFAVAGHEMEVLADYQKVEIKNESPQDKMVLKENPVSYCKKQKNSADESCLRFYKFKDIKTLRKERLNTILSTYRRSKLK